MFAIVQCLQDEITHSCTEHKTQNTNNTIPLFISDFTTPKFGDKKNDREKIVAAVQTVDPATGRVVMLAPDVGLR